MIVRVACAFLFVSMSSDTLQFLPWLIYLLSLTDSYLSYIFYMCMCTWWQIWILKLHQLDFVSGISWPLLIDLPSWILYSLHLCSCLKITCEMMDMLVFKCQLLINLLVLIYVYVQGELSFQSTVMHQCFLLCDN
jgi:hypothetical protein